MALMSFPPGHKFKYVQMYNGEMPLLPSQSSLSSCEGLDCSQEGRGGISMLGGQARATGWETKGPPVLEAGSLQPLFVERRRGRQKGDLDYQLGQKGGLVPVAVGI